MLSQVIDTAMNFRQEAILFLATGFNIGKIPFAPGTFGSLLGLPLCFVLAGMTLTQAVACAALFICFAIWISHTAAQLLKKADPGCIVIDEIAGMLVTLIGLPFNPATAVAGFIFFRVLDILKPFPIRFLDNRVSGGLGVVADDVAAGIIANLLLRIIFYFF
jgi:phosphatidylglycerophosphatase A